LNLLVILTLVLVRTVAVTMTAPILGSHAVGFRTRIALAMVLMMVTLPLVQIPPELSSSAEGNAIGNWQWLPFIFSEAAIGITLGLGVTIMFAAASAAGTVIGQMTGLQLGESSGQDSQSPVSRFYHVVSIAAFALIGGPALVVTAMLDTFIEVPIATTLAQQPMIELVTQLLQQSFMLTLRAVGPVVVALLASNIVMGIIGRTYPQMNLLGLGLSSNIVVMFLSVFLSLGGTMWLFVDDIETTIQFLEESIDHAAGIHESAPHTTTAYSFNTEVRQCP
jgi:flagellar biosynthetic protein FliR